MDEQGVAKHAFYANLGCRHLRAKSLASLGCALKRAAAQSPAFFFFLQKKKKKQKEECQKGPITRQI